MTLSALNKPLTDLGGVPVMWDSDLGTLVQDPTQGGTNTYGPGDVFRDPATGDLYQLQQDGSLALYQVAASPPTVSGPLAPVPRASTVSSAGTSWQTSPGGGGAPAISATGNPTQFGHQVVTWLGKASFIGGLPNGVLVMMGAVAYSFMRQRRRRNPWHVRRQRTRDRSQRAEMFGESQVGRQSYSRTYPSQRAAEREAAAWRSTGDWSADVLEGRAPRKRNPGKLSRMGRRAEARRRQAEQRYLGPYIRETRAVIRGGLNGRRGRLEETYYVAQRRRRARR